jgi:SAM-dependent methyltransferase
MTAPSKTTMRLEHVSCDLCGCAEYRVRYRAPDRWLHLTPFEFPVVQCTNCKLVYVNPRPTADCLSDYYPDQFFANRDNAENLERYRRQIARLPTPLIGRVLDIGCARGDFAMYLKATHPSLDVHGCDPYASVGDAPTFTFHAKHVYDCGFPADHFDLVTSWAVFEHLLTPSRYFAETARILKPKGVFVMLIPNGESLSSAVAHNEDIPRHLYHYSPSSLREYAEKHGLFVDNIEFCDDVYDGRGFGTLTRLAQTPLDAFSDRRPIWKRALLRLVRALDWAVFSPHWEAGLGRGGTMIATIRRR